jgi:hypothetical protein
MKRSGVKRSSPGNCSSRVVGSADRVDLTPSNLCEHRVLDRRRTNHPTENTDERCGTSQVQPTQQIAVRDVEVFAVFKPDLAIEVAPFEDQTVCRIEGDFASCIGGCVGNLATVNNRGLPQPGEAAREWDELCAALIKLAIRNFGVLIAACRSATAFVTPGNSPNSLAGTISS